MRTSVAALILLFAGFSVLADTIELKDGERIGGTVLEYNQNETRIKTKYAEQVIPNADIDRITIDVAGQPVVREKSSKGPETPKARGVPRKGLVSEWLFNGNAADTGEVGNDGRLDGVTTVTNRFNESDAALYFNGRNSLARFAFPYAPLRKGTISLWIKQDALPSASAMLLFANTRGRAKPYFGLYFDSASFRFGRDLYGSDSNFQGFLNPRPTEREWHAVVLVSDGSGLSYYLDGQKASIKWQDGRPSPGLWFGHQDADILTIGGSDRGYPEFFQGAVDDVRIYNRPLSDEEIALLYREGGWTGK